MYLTYDEYGILGGELDRVAFSRFERRAEQLINAQGGGLTGKRISRMDEIPEAVKTCVLDLVEAFDKAAQMVGAVTNESQSSGGVSESISYNIKSDKEIDANCDDILYNAFFGSGYGYLLTRGYIDGD